MAVRIACWVAVSFALATATGVSAQVKLDPRLAAMRSIWIEAEDELSDAPAVSTCLSKHLAGTLPLTVATAKNNSQVIFRFSPIDKTRVQLQVLLHDGQELWVASALVSKPQDACATAEWFIGALRDAMRSARDGTWYSAPTGGPTQTVTPADARASAELEQLERRVRESLNTPAPAPTIPTIISVMDAAYQITEANRVFWRFSWKMRIKNFGPDVVVVSPSMDFKNRGGFVVNSDSASMVTVRAQDTIEVTGMALINSDIAPTVTSAFGNAKRIR